MTQRVSVINSNNTLLVNDYDLSKLAKRQTGGTGGILLSDLVSKPEFDLTIGTGEVTAGKAVIKCIRTASQPISNEGFYILFESDSTETIAVTNGNKIYIEINDTLLQDPTQIEDVPPSTDYSLGIGIGEIKSTANYPSHPNYIKLWEIDGSGVETDMRVYPQIDGDKVDMTNMDQNIKTAGDIESNTAKQTTYTAPINDTDYVPKKYVDDSVVTTSFGGDGTDGDVTITTTVTMTRDMYYRNLTITSPGILNPNGYRIYVRGTLSGDGKIQRNGNNGADAVGRVQGLGGAALNQGSLNADLGGADGANGTFIQGDGNNGGAGSNANPSYTIINGVSGGDSGDGGAGTPGVGGIGGTSVRGELYNIGYDTSKVSYLFSGPASYPIVLPSVQYLGASSSGGGASGNSGGNESGGGGGAGGNGGIIRCAINTIDWTGTFESIGGDGGAGGDAETGLGAGGGGGGGGGQGGVVWLLQDTVTSLGTINVSGGIGGVAGIGFGPSAGDNGNDGILIQVNI